MSHSGDCWFGYKSIKLQYRGTTAADTVFEHKKIVSTYRADYHIIIILTTYFRGHPFHAVPAISG